jgi:sarcosine oxidase, subunit gamma
VDDEDVDGAPGALPIITASRLRLEQAEQLASINLRGNASELASNDHIATIFGCAIAIAANRFMALVGTRTIAWLGPDELLVIAPYADRCELISALDEAVQGTHSAVTDVTGSFIRWRVSGDHARQFLSAGCPIDFHPNSFVTGQCVQTVFARSNVTILQTGASAFEMHLPRSHANYLENWAAITARDLN